MLEIPELQHEATEPSYVPDRDHGGSIFRTQSDFKLWKAKWIL